VTLLVRSNFCVPICPYIRAISGIEGNALKVILKTRDSRIKMSMGRSQTVCYHLYVTLIFVTSGMVSVCYYDILSTREHKDKLV
jgi:polyferredoxin